MAVVFFDIDNTLVDFRGEIPECTVQAVRELHTNGHMAVLCTGRTLGFIRSPKLLSMGFDGIISGCGARVDHKGKRLYEYRFSKEEAEFAVETVLMYRFSTILEGPRHLYLDAEDFIGDRYVNRVAREMGEDLRSLRASWGNWEMNKFSCAVNHETEEPCFRVLGERFDFLRHDPEVVEVVPQGHDKRTGMELFCDALGIDRKETFAFGDAVNDIGMLQWAGMGIVMGNGHEAAKKKADYVTADMWDDGIGKALRHFQLIG